MAHEREEFKLVTHAASFAVLINQLTD